MYKNILIPTDGTELSNRAVVHGTALAKVVGAKVVLLNVVEPFHVFTTDVNALEDTRPQYEQRSRERATKILSAAAEVAKTAGISYECVSEQHSHAYEILQLAEAKHCDLIVMASHGRRGMSALMLGSETNKVLTHTRTPVLVVR